MELEKFTLTQEDEEAWDELRRVLAIMERRKIVGETQAMDYKEAIEKRDREKNIPERKEQTPARDIEDIADTVLFDWDGVLLDSMERISRGAAELIRHLGKEGIPQPSDEEVVASYEAPFWEYYRRFGIPIETEEDRTFIFDYFHERILPDLARELPAEDRLFPGIKETLAELKQKGLAKNPNFKIGIVSAGDPERIQEDLKKYEIDGLIDFVVGSQHSKTEALKRICEESKRDPGRTVYFGDLPSDIRDVRDTGLPIKAVAVARFDSAEDRLGSYDPDYLVHSIGEEIFQLTHFEDRPQERGG